MRTVADSDRRLDLRLLGLCRRRRRAAAAGPGGYTGRPEPRAGPPGLAASDS